jgi:hypothetical protein
MQLRKIKNHYCESLGFHQYVLKVPCALSDEHPNPAVKKEYQCKGCSAVDAELTIMDSREENA